jgi:hypothetical protein
MTRDEIKNTPELVDYLLDKCVIADSREKLHKRMDEICNLAFKALESCDVPEINVGDMISRPKTGHWILYDHGLDAKYYQCSICKGFDGGEKGKYCKWCGAKMEVSE